MKIVCGSCGAKYSIADEKVQGKVFKIRCKKCSNVIVVKGNQDEQAAQEEAAGADDFGGAYGGTAGASEWYVVIDGDQVGPITPEEVEAYAASGRISGETYAWREGLDDWASLASLDAFAHLADAGDMPAEEKTVVADQGFGGHEEEAAPAQASDHGMPDEDATTVMPADDFRSQIEEQDSQVAAQNEMGGYEDQGGFGAADSQAGYDQQEDYGSGAYASGGSNAAAFEESSYGDQGGGFAEESYGSQAGAMDEGGGYDDGGSYDDGGYDAGGGFDSFDDDQDFGDSGDYAGDYADDAGGGDAGGMFSAFDSGDEPEDDGYGGFDSSGFDGGDDAGGSQSGGAQAGGGDAGQQDANDLFASRNENSVLFSLSSLDQVDAVGDEGGGGGGGGGMPGGMGAMAGGGGGGGQDSTTEGSGLIDIQSLASAHSSMSGGEAAGGGGGPSGPASGPDDPFGAGTMSMPALMPMGSKKSNKGLYIGLAIAGVLLLGGIAAAAYVFMTQEDTPKEKVVIKEIIKETGGAENPEEKAEKDKQQAEADKAEKAIKDGAEPEEGEKGEEKDDGEEAKKEVAKKDDSSSRKRDRDPDPRPKPKPKPKPKKKDDIDSIIGSVGSGGGSKDDDSSESSGSSAKSNLPKKLSRPMVKGTIRKYNGRVFNCGKSSNKNNLSGRMMVRFTVQPSGRVSNAAVTTDKFKGTDVGRCVVGVARSMKFPETQSDLTINFPFPIR